MKRRWILLGLYAVCGFSGAQASAPTDAQIERDAASYRLYVDQTFVQASEIGYQVEDGNPGLRLIQRKMQALAQRTNPDYLYGIVTALQRERSNRENPWLIAIMVLISYPPKEARYVMKAILLDPRTKDCPDIKNWLWEIDEAQKTSH